MKKMGKDKTKGKNGKEMKTARICVDNFERLKDDLEFFKKTIGGKWSIDRVITEHYKIMPKKTAKIKHNGKWMKWDTYKKKYTKKE